VRDRGREHVAPDPARGTALISAYDARVEVLADPLSPTLVWGLFQRGLGLVFLISFTSLAHEVVSTAGRAAVIPIAPRLAKFKEDFPGWRRFLYFPTLLWLSSSHAMLRALTLVGLAAAILVVYGGPLSWWALLTCYVCYLSLDVAMVLVFPWDCLLFECAILGLLLPATHALPNLHAVAAPAPALAWAYRLLIFRLMFGFGKQKFLGSRGKDLAYLKGFLTSQTLPSPIGWYAQKLPTVLLKGAVLFMLFVEIIAPFFAFVPGPLSIVFAASTAFLMIGIQLTGTFGYFSLVTIVACLPLLDNVTPTKLAPASLFAANQPVLLNAFVLLHTLCAGVALVFNSWIAQSWHSWSFWYQFPRWSQPVFGFFRLMHPFRWLHPYGVFPPNTPPAAKITPLVEVTWDKSQWHELEYHFSPSNPKSPPRFIAPHHPRTDQALIYEAFGLGPISLLSSVVGPFDPYHFASRGFAPTFCQSVLRGEAGHWLKGAVLEQHDSPPVSVRITTVMLEPVSLREHRATGDWWKRTYVGPHTPPQQLDPQFRDDAMSEPELWHFDAIFWRRRSRLRALMQRALAGNEDPMRLALVDAGTLSSEDVERFWNEFVPLVQGEVRENFDTLPDVVANVNSRFDRKQRRALYRLLGRFSLLVVARLEPLYLYRGNKPLIPAKTYFHLWMLVHHIIGCGRDAYLEAFAHPESVARHLASLTNQTGLYALSVFRLEEMTFEAQKLRLLQAYIYPHDSETKRLMDARLRDEALDVPSAFERFVFRIARQISGFVSVLPDIRDSFKGPRFDRGYPELYPTFEELDSGEVIVKTRATHSATPTLNSESRAAE
jgi:hypothetical protein